MSKQRSPRITLSDIAARCGGELIGDSAATVSKVASLDSADQQSLSFVINAKSAKQDKNWQPGVVLIRAIDADKFTCNRIVVEDPYLAYALVSALFDSPSVDTGINASAHIQADAIVGDDVTIGAGSVISSGCVIAAGVRIGHHVVLEAGVRVGEGTVIESSVTVCRHTVIGARCCVSPGVVIGASGFGYAPAYGQWQKIHQHGRVVIGDDVDIGANTTIDRGAIDDTVIGNRVKMDNQIQIAHNVQVGDDTIMAGCVAIAGSAVIGQRCQIGGRASILGHLQIVDDVVLQADAFVAQSLLQPGVYGSMIPAKPIKQWRKIVGRLNQLDQLAVKIKKLGKNNE